MAELGMVVVRSLTFPAALSLTEQKPQVFSVSRPFGAIVTAA